MDNHNNRPRSPLITSFIAIIATVWILAIFTAVLFIKPVCGEGTANLIIQAIYGLIMLVFGFYFGTSYGSIMKNELLAKAEMSKPEAPQKTCCRPEPAKPEGPGGGGAVG